MELSSIKKFNFLIEFLKLNFYPPVSFINKKLLINISINILIMDNKTVTNLNNIVRSYAKSNALFEDFCNCHLQYISILLNSCDIYDSNIVTRYNNRKFVSFLLWTCREYCGIALNKQLWFFPIEKMLEELLKINSVDKNTLLIYSITKFIGQHTNDKSIYDKCCLTLELIPNIFPENIMTPAQIRHLFAFNPHFISTNQSLPPKINGSNRLVQFYSCAIKDCNFYKGYYKIYSKKRYVLSKNKLVSEPSETNCLYYLDSLYYYTINKHQTMKNLYNTKCKKIDDNYFIQGFIEKLLDYSDSYYVLESCVQNITPSIIDEYSIEISINDIIHGKLLLFSLNVADNHEEILCIINEALTVNDTYANKNGYYEKFRTTIFKKIYENNIVKPFDIYTTYALCNAKNNEITWMQDFLRQKIESDINKLFGQSN
ncbi:putative ORFan [Tupanvirus deep ocean]|uniref:ORFan n=2 Tax=Tupanvirus TaxID=2094720 RepID=A0AC62A837_9VIRU|nr:putative ORFan [Tupanvirus deep ocean]QKU33813.1 putative ORFan [Tupanvirus deep ocean]